MIVLVILAVSAALIIGALWGLYGRLPPKVEGFIIAMAGGALIVSIMSELIQPSQKFLPLYAIIAVVFLGAVVFTVIDYLVDEKFGEESGGGLLAAIALDGIPENLALGVALIGAGVNEVLALAGSIFLSNLPEAAGGAKEMCGNGMSRKKALTLWIATTVILSIAALIGYYGLEDVPKGWLAGVKCFAAGAIVASLATEVFPKAFKEDHVMTGIAVALGLMGALYLSEL